MMTMKKFCLALDLKKDPTLITAYEQWHRAVWPEVRESITSAGIKGMEIYRLEDRLFMIMETEDGFSFEKKAAMDAANPAVQRWEKLMWQYQSAIPGGQEGEKWRLMDLIFSLKQHDV